MSVPNHPPEVGGILGKDSNDIISEVYFDKGKNNGKQCSYVPDTDILNQQILEWKRKNIAFAGIFHTHFFGVETLSEGDIKYINKIMLAMPKQVKYLWFPIVVLPQRKIIAYIAHRENTNVIIECTDLKGRQ